MTVALRVGVGVIRLASLFVALVTAAVAILVLRGVLSGTVLAVSIVVCAVIIASAGAEHRCSQ